MSPGEAYLTMVLAVVVGIPLLLLVVAVIAANIEPKDKRDTYTRSY